MRDRSPLTLRQRIFRAGGWSMGGLAISHLIRLGSNLLMTRLLAPEMFGVMAIASMVMLGLVLFSDLGVRQNVVQSRRGGDAAFLNTAWIVQILRGVLLWAIAVGASLLIVLANRMGIVPADSVYADPVLPYVVAVLTGSAVLWGFESTKIFEASRRLSLGRITQIDLLSQVAGLLCMLAWVSVDRSIWALVAGTYCSTLVSTILSHAWLPGTANRWQWDAEAFREIFHFGKWIFASSILGFLVNNGDRLLLGGLITTTMLGVYVIAFVLFSAVEQVLSKIITDVSFPALSEVARDRPADLKASYYRFHVVIAALAYLFAGALAASGQSLVALLYDSRYAEAGWMLEILAVGLVAVPFRVATQCFLALGKPRLLSNIIAIRLVTLFVMIPAGFHALGLAGAVWGIVLSHLASLAMIVHYKIAHGLFDLRKELSLLPLIPAGMAAGVALNYAVGR